MVLITPIVIIIIVVGLGLLLQQATLAAVWWIFPVDFLQSGNCYHDYCCRHACMQAVNMHASRALAFLASNADIYTRTNVHIHICTYARAQSFSEALGEQRPRLSSRFFSGIQYTYVFVCMYLYMCLNIHTRANVPCVGSGRNFKHIRPKGV